MVDLTHDFFYEIVCNVSALQNNKRAILYPPKKEQEPIETLSQKLYNNCDMNSELRSLILKRVKESGLDSFSCFDFTDLANYKTISKCLERLEDEKIIKRIVSGIYCLALHDDVLNIDVLPSVDSVVQTLARKNRWIVCPTGDTALNAMGLSTQVVASYVYLTNGPYKTYEIFGNEVKLKRTMNREISGYSPITNLLIQCIKAIGEGNIEEREIEQLEKRISETDKCVIIKETVFVQTWIRNIIVKICEIRK